MVHAVAIVLPAVNALEKKTVERVTETLRYTRRRGWLSTPPLETASCTNSPPPTP